MFDLSYSPEQKANKLNYTPSKFQKKPRRGSAASEGNKWRSQRHNSSHTSKPPMEETGDGGGGGDIYSAIKDMFICKVPFLMPGTPEYRHIE